MKQNVGTADMLARIIIGAVLVYLGFAENAILSDGLPKTVVGFFAFVPILTGLVRFCPLYALIGVTTKGGSSCSTE